MPVEVIPFALPAPIEVGNTGLILKPERVKLEPKAHRKFQDFLEARIIGQQEATEAFSHLAVRIKSGIRKQSGIIDSKFLAGPSGVGKTEITLTLARLFDSSDGPPRFTKVDCGLLQQPHEMSKLVGSPPGYVGSEGTNNYIEPVLSPENLERNTIEYTDSQGKKRKLLIILFDEFEKAHPALQRMLLVSLDKGTIQTASNKDVNLSNSVILFTSNVGNQEVERKREQNNDGAKEIVIAEMNKIFPPEFRGRVNDVIIFRHLTKEACAKITEIELNKVQSVFRENGINVKLSPSDQLIEHFAQNGLNPSEGARAIIKMINEQITDNLIAGHVDFNINNHEIILDLDENGKPSLYFGEKIEENLSETDGGKTSPEEKQSEQIEIKEPIEQLKQRLIDKLNEEFKNLNDQSDEESQSPIQQYTNNIEYIHGLNARIPELKEYFRRRQITIMITAGKVILGKKIIKLIYDEQVNFAEQLHDYGGFIVINIFFRPGDKNWLQRHISDYWDTGHEDGIKKIGSLNKREIVEQLLKLRGL